LLWCDLRGVKSGKRGGYRIGGAEEERRDRERAGGEKGGGEMN
jgi:hypothetical protein